MDVAGKVALLTGGARIGQAVAEAIAQRGCGLALTAVGRDGPSVGKRIRSASQIDGYVANRL